MAKVKIKKYRIGDKTYKIAYLKDGNSYSYLGIVSSASEIEKRNVENTYFNDIIFSSYLGSYQAYYQAFIDAYLKRMNELERREYEQKYNMIFKKINSYLKKMPEVSQVVRS